jgi:hypothetical protein
VACVAGLSEASILQYDIRQLRVEIQALSELHAQLFYEINEAVSDHHSSSKAQHSWQGQALNKLSYLFSCYCIYKIGSSVANLVAGRILFHDPITRLQIALLWLLDVKIDPDWAQNASFVAVGFIAATQLRGFLLHSMKLFHHFSSPFTAYSIILLMAELLGMYFVSSVVLMRMNLLPDHVCSVLPPSALCCFLCRRALSYGCVDVCVCVQRRIITQLMGDVDFVSYHDWFDLLFLITAISTIIGRFLQRQAQRRQLALETDNP